jgi:hypothetical protein
MTTIHLTDEQLQMEASGEVLEPETSAHLQSCPDCKARLGNYLLLFKRIDEIPPVAFDFDLAKRVVEQLPSPIRSSTYPQKRTPALAGMAVLFSGVIALLLRDYLTGSGWLLVMLVVIGAIPALLFLATGLIARYQKRLRMLDTEHVLQQI